MPSRRLGVGGLPRPAHQVLALDVADHTFQLRAIDPTGNPDSTPARLHVEHSTTPPVASNVYCGQLAAAENVSWRDVDRLPEIGLSRCIVLRA